MNHYPGHQQVLIKNNIVIAVLSFEAHKRKIFKKTFKMFDHDFVINLCSDKFYSNPAIGDLWSNNTFKAKPYPSWDFKEDLEWHPPIPKPEGLFLWEEETLSWQEADPNCGCIKKKV